MENMQSPVSVSRSIEAGILQQLPCSPSNVARSKTPTLQDPTPGTRESSIGLSPAPSTLSEDMVANSTQGPGNSSNPAKRRKLTFAEKEVLRIEKAHKEQLKAAEKARKEEEKKAKDEERKIKDEEKRKKEEEKEEKRKVKEVEKAVKDDERKKKEAEKAAKEAEKKAKDEEKKVKDEEKLKKERSQTKLNSFFAKPTSNTTPTGSPVKIENTRTSRRGSVTSVNSYMSRDNTPSPSSAAATLQIEYEKRFPAFFLHSHTSLAPINRFHPQQATRQESAAKLDSGALSADKMDLSCRINELLRSKRRNTRKRYRNPARVRDIIAGLQGGVNNPIDLIAGASSTQELDNPLDEVPMKFLRFYEDVRPPYVGTFTKAPADRSISSLCRNPFSRALPNTNYDYDSEAEWEEPGEGEDLDSEGEEELDEEEGVDDMDGFLDDDDDAVNGVKSKHIMGDKVPVSTGLCWEGLEGKKRSMMVPYGNEEMDLRQFELDVLSTNPVFPIDPFSTSYWASQQATSSNAAPITTQISTPQSVRPSPFAMPPPAQRVPLHTVSPSAANLPIVPVLRPGADASKLPLSNGIVVTKLPKKSLPADLLEDFKRAVDGSDLTKAGLIEILKKQFPKVGKDTIKDTVGIVAERIGKTEVEKRWRLK
ncbi:hypothetical protein MMC25_004087 [Agyrium rufum]|nr:hypothetical protein [Agyrium rufum]